jgi:hypothetical protein
VAASFFVINWQPNVVAKNAPIISVISFKFLQIFLVTLSSELPKFSSNCSRLNGLLRPFGGGKKERKK